MIRKRPFVGKSVMKPEQAEIKRLKKEVNILRIDRDILLPALSQGVNVKYGFVANIEVPSRC